MKNIFGAILSPSLIFYDKKKLNQHLHSRFLYILTFFSLRFVSDIILPSSPSFVYFCVREFWYFFVIRDLFPLVLPVTKT